MSMLSEAAVRDLIYQIAQEVRPSASAAGPLSNAVVCDAPKTSSETPRSRSRCASPPSTCTLTAALEHREHRRRSDEHRRRSHNRNKLNKSHDFDKRDKHDGCGGWRAGDHRCGRKGT